MSNEEKTNDHENFEKGMIYMKILKKGGGGSREKGGGGNEIHAPCACELEKNSRPRCPKSVLLIDTIDHIHITDHYLLYSKKYAFILRFNSSSI